MKFWAINRRLKDLVVERDACGGKNPSIENQIARLEKYTRDVVDALSQNKDKNAVLDFTAWINAQNGKSHTKINRQVDRAGNLFDEGFHDTEDSESDSDKDSAGRDIARGIAAAKRANSKKKEWVAGQVPINTSYLSVSKQLRDCIVACMASSVDEDDYQSRHNHAPA